jgi:3-deoxy-7-phosphoheptulonate synthase
MTTPDSWRALPAAQQPPWPDPTALAEVEAELAAYPPLVAARSSDRLRDRLAEVAAGRAFLLQAGDCAETFTGVTPVTVLAKLRCIMQMAVVLGCASGLPVVQVGRIAGQYAKPRSVPLETRDAVTLTSYFGDAVNDAEFSKEARRPDPRRLLRTYHSSAASLDEISALVDRDHLGLADLHRWTEAFATRWPDGSRHRRLAEDVIAVLRFLQALGAPSHDLGVPEFYTSHEALLLNYEAALTRIDPRTRSAYDTSAHLIWLGERTRQIDGAHVEFASRVRNPIAVKLGPTALADDVLHLIDRLDPHREPGRLTLITRMGADRVRDLLPDLVAKVTASGSPAVWVCDPMHGNTITAPSGHKTRRFDDILSEVRGFFAVHRDLGTLPGGLHLELTGEFVTECVGGYGGTDLANVPARYTTTCDPRLNYDQTLDLAFAVGAMIHQTTTASEENTACAPSRTSTPAMSTSSVA